MLSYIHGRFRISYIVFEGKLGLFLRVQWLISRYNNLRYQITTGGPGLVSGVGHLTRMQQVLVRSPELRMDQCQERSFEWEQESAQNTVGCGASEMRCSE